MTNESKPAKSPVQVTEVKASEPAPLPDAPVSKPASPLVDALFDAPVSKPASPLVDALFDSSERSRLINENERLKAEVARLTATTGAVDDRKLTAAVGDRTTMLEGEVNGLRAQVALLEKQLRDATKT